jgi:hypothetical protein
MRLTVASAVALALVTASLAAQETKPVPKNSVRVTVPGCTKGYVFTVAPRTVEAPGSADVPAGMHLRLNAPKKMMNDIKAHEGTLIQVTGLIRKGQYGPGGVSVGGVRIAPSSGNPQSGTLSMGGQANLVMMDVEGWQQAAGECR